MTKTKLTAIIAGALAATVLLAGCTQPAPKPTQTAVATKTATPAPASAQKQDPVGPPASSDEAYIAANKTISGFLTMDFKIRNNPSRGAGEAAEYASGTALSDEQQVVQGLTQKGWKVTGSPAMWTADPSLSFYGQVATSSKTYPNAIAYMKGCVDTSKEVTVATPGAVSTPSDNPVKSNPVQITVEWMPSSRVWLVTAAASLSGSDGAPQC